MTKSTETHTFRSADEAISFFAQRAEDRYKETNDTLRVIESALKAIFAVSPDARDTALSIADSFEAPPIPDALEERISAIAAGLRKLALASAEEASAVVKFSVIDGGLSTEE